MNYFQLVTFFPTNPLLNLLCWAGLLAIPPLVILLYFLKLKRQPLEVPSTYLWSRTIEDLHVNTIWQRLRQSLLLFLQLLLLLLIILAFTQPGFQSSRLVGDRFIFLIDTSGSMGATDVKPTRLGKAKQLALRVVDDMEQADVGMVISFSDSTGEVQSFTNDKRILRERILGLQQTNRTSNLDEAIRAAAGLANPGRTSTDLTDVQVAKAQPATLYVFSDGGFPEVQDFALQHLTCEYVPVGDQSELPPDDPTYVPKPVPNVGVVAFTTERNSEKPTEIQAFARFENHGPEDVVIEAELYLDGELIDAQSVEIDKDGGTSGAEFDLPDLESGTLRLDIKHDDMLSIDNVAYAPVNSPRPARVLVVSPRNEAIQVAMETDQVAKLALVEFADPDILETEEHTALAQAGYYDAMIYDQCAPKKMPQSNTLFIGTVPPLEGWQAGEVTSSPFVIDIDKVHPLTQMVYMDKVSIFQGFDVQAPAGSLELMTGTNGSLLVVAPRDGYEDAVLGFKIYDHAEGHANTNWVIRRSFPVFVFNVVRYLGGNLGSLASPSYQPGRPVQIRTEGTVTDITVESPAAARKKLQLEGLSFFVYSNSDDLGVYKVFEGKANQPTQQFAVNLFDSRESNLTVEPTINIDNDVIAGTAALTPVRRELWKWLLIAGLVVLIFEWYIYNKRVYL